MPSSIFSSSARVPLGDLTAPWLGAVVVGAALLMGLEADFRAHGQTPYVGDSPSVVAIVADEAKRAGPDAIVVAGSSRSEYDIDAPTLSAALGGRRVFQLGQSGEPCMPVLEEFVNTTNFAGTIICGVEPTGLFGFGERDRERTGEPRYPLPSERWDDRLALRARFYLEKHIVILGRDPRAYFGRLAGHGTWPPPPPPRNVRATDRVSRLTFGTGPLDTTAADIRNAGLFEIGGGRATTPDELSATIDYLNALVRRFAARGGRVGGGELPRSGRTRAVEDRRYPRAQYWDKFAARVEPAGSAFTVSDSPALAAFNCPDGSHLDAAAAIPFTQELAAALASRILPLKKPGT